MSFVESPSNETERPQRRRIQRRHGACEPCRTSKTKCDGRTPCGACRSERRRQSPCVYSEKARKLQQVTAEIRRRVEHERRCAEAGIKLPSDDESSRLDGEEVDHVASQTMAIDDTTDPSSKSHIRATIETEHHENESVKMAQPLSVCAAVEEFKRLKPARGYSAQVVARCNGYEVYDSTLVDQDISTISSSGFENTSSPEKHDQNGDDVDSDVHLGNKLRLADTIIMKGDLNRAWVDLGSIVRGVQSGGAHSRDDRHLCQSEPHKKLWSQSMEFEAQLGLILGQPTCSVLGSKARPDSHIEVLQLEDESLETTKIELWQHIQDLLSLNLTSSTAIRDFLERARNVLQHEPFNQVSLCTTEGHSVMARDLQLNTHLLFMVIFCRMASLCDLFSRDLTNNTWIDTPAADMIRSMNLHQPRQKLTYCRKMFRSARFILNSFLSLHDNDMRLTGTNWIRCHSAYIAAMILGIAKLRHEVEWHATTDVLRNMEQKFCSLSKSNPECSLLATALNRLQDLNSVKEPASEATRNKHNGMKGRKRSATNSVDTSPRSLNYGTLTATSVSTAASPTTSLKRTVDMVDGSILDNRIVRNKYVDTRALQDDEYPPQSNTNSTFEDLQLDQISYYPDSSTTYSQSNSSFAQNSVSSATTSFSEADLPFQILSEVPQGHPGPPFAYPFPYENLHPPMSWGDSIYPATNQGLSSLSLRVPEIVNYDQEGSTSTGQNMPAPQYSLRNIEAETNEKSTNINQHQLSPAHHNVAIGTITSDCPSTTPRGSLNQASTIGSADACTNFVTSNQTHQYLQPMERSLTNELILKNTHGRSFDGKRPSNGVQQPTALLHAQSQPSAAVWENVPVASSGNHSIQAQVGGVKNAEALTVPRNPHPMAFMPSGVGTSQNVFANQIFPPDHIPCFNPATGTLEAQHSASVFPQGTISMYPKNYHSVPSNQYASQWRRTSIDTSATNPY